MACVFYYSARHRSEHTSALGFLKQWHAVNLLGKQDPAPSELFWDLYADGFTDAARMSYRTMISVLGGPMTTSDVGLWERLNGNCGSATKAHAHMNELADSKEWLPRELNESLRDELPENIQDIASQP